MPIQAYMMYKQVVKGFGKPTQNRDCKIPSPAPVHMMISRRRPRSPPRANRQIGVYVPAMIWLQIWTNLFTGIRRDAQGPLLLGQEYQAGKFQMLKKNKAVGHIAADKPAICTKMAA